jgi:hypothetical protein
MTLPTDYVDGDVLTAADVNAITVAVNSNTNSKIDVGTFNAKGDLLVGLTDNSAGVLTVGTNGYLLSASSGATAGVAWVPSGGKVLQIQSDYVSTVQSTSSTTGVDIPGLEISFTPISASSKLLVEMTGHASVYNFPNTTSSRIAFLFTNAGGTVVLGQYYQNAQSTSDTLQHSYVSRTLVDNTSTSARTYKGQFQVQSGSTVELQNGILLTVTEYAA